MVPWTLTGPDKEWELEGRRHDWTLPDPAPWWQRMPVIRHIRAAVTLSEVEAWDRQWRAIGMIPTGYDKWVIYAIRRGWV